MKTLKSSPVSKVIEIDDVYFGLFDLGSPANKAGHYLKARDVSREPYGDDPGHLDEKYERFEQYWNHRQESRELLVWDCMGGVCRIEIDLIAGKTPVRFSARQKEAFLVGQNRARELECPTGRIAVESLTRLGERALKPMIKVSPGTYRVGLDRNEAQVVRHRWLKSAADYPPSDGPDFVIHLQRRA